MYGSNTHRLLECRGCETVFYLRSSWNSEDCEFSYNPITQEEEIEHAVTLETFPSIEQKSSRPEWIDALLAIDKLLKELVDQTYAAFDSELWILATIGLRTALDRAVEFMDIDPAITFAEKIKYLQSHGYIGAMEAAQLTTLVEAGNAAVHRAWSPAKQDCRALITVLEHFLQRNFIPSVTGEIASRLPAKPKRLNKDGNTAV